MEPKVQRNPWRLMTLHEEAVTDNLGAQGSYYYGSKKKQKCHFLDFCIMNLVHFEQF